MRPRIALTRGESDPDRYRGALQAAGADVLEIRAGTPLGQEATANPEIVIAMVDGLVLSGGRDVHPRVYGERDVHSTVVVDADRDGMELMLCRTAIALRLPLLGICRGLQVMNVVGGGTLWQDLPALRPGTAVHMEASSHRDRRRRLHTATPMPDTLSSRIIGMDLLPVNSIHHQAVRSPAPGFRVGALAPDGVVEAIEAEAAQFAIAVQWHPEELREEDARHAALFAALCRAAVIPRPSSGASH